VVAIPDADLRGYICAVRVRIREGSDGSAGEKCGEAGDEGLEEGEVKEVQRFKS